MGERCNDVPLANMWEYGEKSPRKGFISDFRPIEPPIYATIKKLSKTEVIKNDGNNKTNSRSL
jgi:hypothetical protein